MDSLFGLVGDGFVLIAADTLAVRSILVYKQDKDKIMELDTRVPNPKLLASAGDPSDCVSFTEFIQKNMELQYWENSLQMTTHGAANYIRKEMATNLRKRMYQTNLLLGGYDESEGPSLYFMDYLSTMQKMNFGAHGYGANFCLSILDREWKEGLTVDEAVEIIRKCVQELNVRFLIGLPTFKVKIADKNGIRELDLIKA